MVSEGKGVRKVAKASIVGMIKERICALFLVLASSSGQFEIL